MSKAKAIEYSYYLMIDKGYEDITPLINSYHTARNEKIARIRFFKNLKRKNRIKNIKKYVLTKKIKER